MMPSQRKVRSIFFSFLSFLLKILNYDSAVCLVLDRSAGRSLSIDIFQNGIDDILIFEHSDRHRILIQSKAVGADGRMEMERVPAAGYEIIGLPVAGLQRKLTLSNLALPFKVLKSLRMAKKIIKEEERIWSVMTRRETSLAADSP